MKEIFDPLRDKFVEETPEEKVRQMMIRWLHHEKGVSYRRMSSEYGFKYNGLNYRADIVIFGESAEPIALVECKAEGIKMDKSVLDQGLRYNKVLKAKYLIFTNGSSMICLYDNTGSVKFLTELPDYKQMLSAGK